MKKLVGVLSLLTMFILSCGTEGTGTSGEKTKKIKVGITQIVEHPALNKAKQGFKDALKEAGMDVEYDEKNANGEVATANLIANTLVSSKPDLIYAIATTTTQAVAQATNDIPVVFSAITDPESAGILKENVTGVSDRVNIKQQLELMKKLNPNAKKVGVIFNSSEQNSMVQVNDLKTAASELGMEVVATGVTQASEIPQASETLIAEVDMIYTPTDNLVASLINLITEKAIAAKKIVFGAEASHVEGGALITQGVDYYELGKRAGQMAIEILKGKKTSEIKFETIELNDIVVNENTLNALGISLPEEIKSKVKFIK